MTLTHTHTHRETAPWATISFGNEWIRHGTTNVPAKTTNSKYTFRNWKMFAFATNPLFLCGHNSSYCKHTHTYTLLHGIGRTYVVHLSTYRNWTEHSANVAEFWLDCNAMEQKSNSKTKKLKLKTHWELFKAISPGWRWHHNRHYQHSYYGKIGVNGRHMVLLKPLPAAVQ